MLITNQVGGLFDIQTDANIGYVESGHGLLYVFHNAGTLRKSAGTGTNTFHSNLAFINTGAVELQQGGLAFPNGFNSSGTFNLAADTVVNLDGGTFTFGASSLKTGAGQLLVDGGDVTLKGTVPGLSWTGGRLVSSSFTVPAGAVLAISGSADKVFVRTAINNAGTITWTGTGQLVGTTDNYGQSLLIANLPGGLFDIQTDSASGLREWRLWRPRLPVPQLRDHAQERRHGHQHDCQPVHLLELRQHPGRARDHRLSGLPE